jgi:hypothetical protein
LLGHDPAICKEDEVEFGVRNILSAPQVSS